MSQQQQQQQGTGSGSTTLYDLDDYIFDEAKAEEETSSPPHQQGQQPYRSSLLIHQQQNMSQQQQHQQQQGTRSTKLSDPDGGSSSPKQGQPHPRLGGVSYKDQMREALSPSSSLGTTAATGATTREGERTATAAPIAADDIPIVSAVAVSESRIQAEAHEDRLQEAEQRAAAAEAARQAAVVERRAAVAERRAAEADRRVAEAAQRSAETARRDQEVRLAQLERELAAVRPPLPPPPPLPQQTRNIFIRHEGEGDVDAIEDFDNKDVDDADDDDDENGRQQQKQRPVVGTTKATTIVEDTAVNNSGASTPKQLSQRQRCCIVVMAVGVLIAAAAVAGICGAVDCSSPTPSPVPQPIVLPPVVPLPVVPSSAPQPAPVMAAAVKTPAPTKLIDFDNTSILPVLTIVGAEGTLSDTDLPLPKCHGDCNRNTDCDGNLVCFSRGGATTIPGCFGRADADGTDYCWDPNDKPAPGVLAHVGNNGNPPQLFPLQRCTGQCTSNDDCVVGLVCLVRDRDTDPVYGCTGPLVDLIDYCVDPADLPGGGIPFSRRLNGRLDGG